MESCKPHAGLSVFFDQKSKSYKSIKSQQGNKPPQDSEHLVKSSKNQRPAPGVLPASLNASNESLMLLPVVAPVPAPASSMVVAVAVVLLHCIHCNLFVYALLQDDNVADKADGNGKCKSENMKVRLKVKINKWILSTSFFFPSLKSGDSLDNPYKGNFLLFWPYFCCCYTFVLLSFSFLGQPLTMLRQCASIDVRDFACDINSF